MELINAYAKILSAQILDLNLKKKIKRLDRQANVFGHIVHNLKRFQQNLKSQELLQKLIKVQHYFLKI